MTVHVVGGGVSGLAAAVALAEKNVPVTVTEAAGQAGGRCRSYHDAALDQIIDNGNHLILSGNRAVAKYLRTIGAENHFTTGPAHYAFADLKTNARWTIRLSQGKIPWWIFSSATRVPETKASDYLALLPLLLQGRDKRFDESFSCRGALWTKLLQPFLVAALNSTPEESSRALVSEIVRESLAQGGAACRPRIATPTLAAALIDPAIAFAQARHAKFSFGNRLQRVIFDRDRAIALECAQNIVPVHADDAVILALPPAAAQSLLPGTNAPDAFNSIVSGHFRMPAPKDAPAMIGVLSATIEWIFLFPDRISVTVSNAGHIVDEPREALAQRFWREVAHLLHLPETLPPWQIVKEKRATFAATPEQNAKRPGPVTRYKNVFLAGDWTQTRLPATLEGAVRSGYRAAELAMTA